MNLSHNTGKILTLEGDNSYHNGNGFVAPGTPGDAARMEAGLTIGRRWRGSSQGSMTRAVSCCITRMAR